MKKIVAPIVSTKGKIMNVSGDVLGKVLPGPLGQFENVAGKAWGAVGNIADNVAKNSRFLIFIDVLKHYFHF